MPQQKQAPESFVDFRFPTKGIDLSQAYSLQPADTTPVGQNVRAYDAIGARARGGSRPGLAKYVPALVGVGGLIQEINSVVGVGYNPPGPTGVQGYIQNSAGISGGTGTQSDTFASPTTAGSGILVIVGVANGAYPSAITDAAGNSYTRINNASLGSATCSAWLATATTSVSGFTATISGAYTGVSIVGFEVAGPATTDMGGAFSAASNPGTSASITTTNANDFAYLAIQTIPGGQIQSGPGGAWQAPSNQSFGGTFLVAFQNLYTIQTGLTGTWTFHASVNWSSVIGSQTV